MATRARHRPSLEIDQVDTLAAEIPAAVSNAAAPRTGSPTFWLEPDGKVAYAYREAAGEILERLAAPVR